MQRVRVFVDSNVHTVTLAEMTLTK